jgi:hypothetical protein
MIFKQAERHAVFMWAHYEKLDANDNNVCPIKAVVASSAGTGAMNQKMTACYSLLQRGDYQRSIPLSNGNPAIGEVMAYVLPSIEHRANAHSLRVSKKQNTLLPFLLESRGGILVKTS